MSVFTPEGKLIGSDRQTVPTPSSGGNTEDHELREVLWRCDLNPGRYELRLAAYSTALEKSGSVYADVTIPDFASAPLSLSGAVLSVTAAAPPTPNVALAAVIPIVPTIRREFAPEDKVKVFVRVYQGGRKPVFPVLLKTRILDADDRPSFERQETVPTDQFLTSRAADYLVELPLARLAGGAYIFILEAAIAGHPIIRRHVRFLVR
jgi:hypothetical protein